MTTELKRDFLFSQDMAVASTTVVRISGCVKDRQVTSSEIEFRVCDNAGNRVTLHFSTDSPEQGGYAAAHKIREHMDWIISKYEADQ